MLFVFLSAMFGLVFSNNLVWILFFWEITTFCSFVLIGYSQTEEATSNAFLALSMNLLGGVAFAAALIYIASMDPSGRLLELNTLIYSGLVFAIIPAVLICFAGLTKAAQLPFSSWLLGAMVAPTPVSALLHSSTMVKAGVYIIVRFAPVLMGTTEGLMIALIGGITFLLASCMAISQSNAKRVLAYSTIGNLGLIVACAGVGTYNLMWVAILLMIFHAVAKSLLFLCVGTVENRIGRPGYRGYGRAYRAHAEACRHDVYRHGRDVPCTVWYDHLQMGSDRGVYYCPLRSRFHRYPCIRWFGQPLFLVQVDGKDPLGDAAPGERGDRDPAEKWAVLYILTGLVVIVALIFPLISSTLIEPFVMQVYGETTRLAQANITIMLLMLGLLIIMPFSMLFSRKAPRIAPPYMGGMSTEGGMKYTGSMGISHDLVLSNYYLKNYFGEERLSMAGTLVCWGLILIAFIMIAGVIL